MQLQDPAPPDESNRSRKQAVVLIHGMGEQVPLGTLREFVETVYQRDTNLPAGETTYANDAQRSEGLRQVWIVPDDATGTAELRRITTPPDAFKRRTDFFELYWADITEGTPIEAVLGWIRGLILRPFGAVPKRAKVIIAWLLLWVVSIAFAVFTVTTLDPTGTLVKALMEPVKPFLIWIHIPVGTMIALAGVFAWAHEHNKPAARVKVTAGLVLVAGGLLFAFLPRELLESEKMWSGLIAVLLALLLNQIIAPYVGDVVRYVRANPATVERRRLVRERGLKLLEDLHAKRHPEGDPMYERIVVVAHSLGSIVGYDLIQLYWEKHGPTHNAALVPDAAPAYDAVNAFVAHWVDAPEHGEDERAREEREKHRWDGFNLKAYQQAQSDVFDVVKEHLNFRISDFVTVGSPLTHAQFLLRDDKEALDEEFKARLFSSSPPRPDLPRSTMTYTTHEGKGPYVHFAAPFAAVRWTNIHDECWFPFGGDVVSGPLTPIFGPGIDERPVRITRPGMLWPLDRLVTHTLYWSWHPSFQKEVPGHIKALREAVFLGPEIDSRLSRRGDAAKAERKVKRDAAKATSRAAREMG